MKFSLKKIEQCNQSMVYKKKLKGISDADMHKVSAC